MKKLFTLVLALALVASTMAVGASALNIAGNAKGVYVLSGSGNSFSCIQNSACPTVSGANSSNCNVYINGTAVSCTPNELAQILKSNGCSTAQLQKIFTNGSCDLTAVQDYLNGVSQCAPTCPPAQTVPETPAEEETPAQPEPSAPVATPAPTPEPTATPTPTPSTPVTEEPAPTTPVQDNGSGVTADNLAYEARVVELVNEYRTQYGLAALTLNQSLSNVARVKSQDMRDNNYFDHNSPTYGSPFDMLKAFGISYRYAGENIAAGYVTPEAVVEAWMNSPGHRANILNANYTQIGVGYVASGSYWTQEFIG
ncbi:hypothetical protein SDC9_91545 [bioreactor metagenome]|uniref:SCP domain-containing protein n=1 Tax=bioreactor metagenome TaxID=1076179 RepID=A0A645A1Z1_9ZZZZ